MDAKLKLSAEDVDRLIKRQEFSTSYISLNSKVRGFAPSYFKVFKLAFYNVKSDEALLDKKDIVVNRKREDPKKPAYNQYINYAEAIELDYLIKGLTTVRKLILELSDKVVSFNYFASQLLKEAISLRKQFYKETGMFPEDFPRAEKSIGTLRATKTKIREEAFNEKFGGLKKQPLKNKTKVSKTKAVTDNFTQLTFDDFEK